MKKLKHKILTLLIVVCTLHSYAQVLTSTSSICSGTFAPFGGGTTSNIICNPSSTAWLNKYSKQGTYSPTPIPSTPLITLKITLHIFTKSDSTAAPGLWENNPSAIGSPALFTNYLNQITNGNADRFTIPRSASYSASFPTPLTYVSDSRIKYEVTNIYYYPSDVLYPWPTNTVTYYQNPAPHLNYIQTNYPGRLDEGLPILIANTGWNFATGYNGAPIVATSISYYDPGFFKEHLLHEIGHCFGLYHTYYPSQGDELPVYGFGHPDFLSDVFPIVSSVNSTNTYFGNNVCNEGGSSLSNNVMSNNPNN